MWSTKSYPEKSGVPLPPIFYPERLGETNLKSSECKISRTQLERNFPEIFFVAQKKENQKGSVGIFTCIQEQSTESSAAYLQMTSHHQICDMTKLKQFSNEFDLLYSREGNPCIGVIQYLRSRGVLFQKDLEKEQAFVCLFVCLM